MARLTGVKTLLGIDLRALAAFRVAIGSLLALDTVMRWQDLKAHYSDAGLLPSAPYIEQFANPLHVSLHLANGSVWWQALLFSLTLAAALAVVVGYHTRAATVVAWVLLISVQNRNPLLLNGGDILLRLLFFWSMFLPLGAWRSVDAALASPPEPTTPTRLTSAATIGIILQIVMVYLVTFLLKDGTEWWPNGTASYLALSLEEFTTGFGLWIREWPVLLRVSSYVVYFLEGSVVFGVLCPFYSTQVRLVLIAMLTVMHLNFDLAMRLGLFPWIDMAALLVLLPTPALDWLGPRLGPPPDRALRLYYDGSCDFCKKLVHLIRGLWLPLTTEIAPAPSAEHAWIVVDQDGGSHSRWDACVTVLEHGLIGGPLLRRLPLRALAPAGDRLADLVARHRAALSRKTAALLHWHGPRTFEAHVLTNLAAFFFLGYVGLWNLKTLPRSGVDIASPWVDLGSILRLDQKWNMFAPFPLKEGGWYVIPGELNDGTKVDVFTGEPGEVSFAKPPLISARYSNARWRKYMMNIWERDKKDYRLYYGKFLCRAWNTEHDDAKKLVHFEIYFMRMPTVLPPAPQTIEKVSIWQHDCFKKKAASH